MSAADLLGLEGRVGRLRYFCLGTLVLMAAVLLFALSAVLIEEGGGRTILGAATLTVGGLACVLSYTSLTARRLHDLGLSAGSLAWLMPLRALCAY